MSYTLLGAECFCFSVSILELCSVKLVEKQFYPAEAKLFQPCYSVNYEAFPVWLVGIGIIYGLCERKLLLPPIFLGVFAPAQGSFLTCMH